MDALTTKLQDEFPETVMVLKAPGEADRMLVALVNSGRAHAAISEDGDVIAMGCMRVLRKVPGSGCHQYHEVLHKNLRALRQYQGLDDEQVRIFADNYLPVSHISLCVVQFQALMVLGGNDHFKINGVALATANTLIQRVPSTTAAEIVSVTS
ncbi:MAG: hypothetical protein JST16_00705 [Bdellovibrionales bacterium]|nr:hypothetical protein [Bdellovibrionales bacterium]